MPRPDSQVVYTKVDGKELKLRVFTPEGHKATDSRPAIVFFFGTKFEHGNPRQLFGHCDYLASRGMVAISADYRVVKKKKKEEPRRCLQDACAAMRYVRTHARDLGIDPEKIAAGGFDVGGQLAAATAFADGIEGADANITVSPRPNALVMINAPLDMGPDGYDHEWVKDYWQDFSPLHNIDKDTPPTALFYGANEKMASEETVARYARAMKDAGVRCDVYTYDTEEHYALVGKEMGADSRKAAIDMDRFLASLGYLEGEPTITAQPDAGAAE
jgi:acetyl esterase/lipase